MSFRLEYKRGSTAPAMFQRQVSCRAAMLGTESHGVCHVSGPDASWFVPSEQVRSSHGLSVCDHLHTDIWWVASHQPQPQIVLSLLQETFGGLEGFASTYRAWSVLPGEPRQPRPGRAGGRARGARWVRAALVGQTPRRGSQTGLQTGWSVIDRWESPPFSLSLCFSLSVARSTVVTVRCLPLCGVTILQEEQGSPRCRPHSGPVEIPSYLFKVGNTIKILNRILSLQWAARFLICQLNYS